MNKALKIFVGMVGGTSAIFLLDRFKTYIKEIEMKKEKFKSYYNVLNLWLQEKQNNKNLSKYFEQNNYKTIAIYGMGEIGKRLYEELKETDIKVLYAVDQVDNYLNYLPTKLLDEELLPVDAIIVTPIYDFDTIKENLSKKIDFPIISIEDVIIEN